MSKMRYNISVLCLCTIISVGTANEIEPAPDEPPKYNKSSQKTDSTIPILVGNKPKIEFPTKATDDSTPILLGDNPKKSNLPPRIFPKKQEKDLANPTIVSGIDTNMEINHSKEGNINVTNDKISENTNITKIQTNEKKYDKGEQEDMLHSKYKGGQDVDELNPEKKVAEKDENTEQKKDPKSDVTVTSTLDEKGPKSMNETKTKSRESMLESTSKMMAVSSSVLANTQPKEHGIIEPGKTVVSVLLTAVALVCFGAIGLLVWKRISMRKFGRDVLINEDDFDEVADMHTFDRAQIQIT